MVAVISLTNCSSTTTVYKEKPVYEVNPYSTSEYISKDVQGLVTLRGVSDEANSEAEATNGSQRKALEKLFYQGFPGTDFKQAMISGYTKSTVEGQHQEYFKSFWNGGYKEFITKNDTKTYKCASKSNCFTASTTFTINYNNLRKELERNNIIKKMGF